MAAKPAVAARLRRLESALSGGALAGALGTSAMIWLRDFAAQSKRGWSLPENLLLNLLGSVPEFVLRPYFFLFQHHWILVVLPALVLLLVWRRTRRALLIVLTVLLAATAAWVAAMACGLADALDSLYGKWPLLAALPIALLLTFSRRWQTASTMILAAGFALGTLLAQSFYSMPFQDAFEDMLHPLWGFAPPVAAGMIGAVWFSFRRRRRAAQPGRWRSAATLWAMLTCCLACAVAFAAEVRGIRLRPPEPLGSRIVDDWAYDVHITGDPPQLVWTDRQRIHVMTNPYGEQHDFYTVDDDEAYYVERIWPSPTDGFYIQGSRKLDWWKAPRNGARVTYRPTIRYRLPEWLIEDGNTTWTIVEDAEKKQLFTNAEYYSHHAVLHLKSGALLAKGIISNSMWPFWHYTGDLQNRILYATSALDDGGLYVMNLDNYAIERKATNLYLYETALDRDKHLLWGVRPLTGEVVSIDTNSFAMRDRIPVQFGLRDLQRDPQTGDMYTCSEIFGGIFRIDGRSLQVTQLGWCGRLCRSMHYDAKRHGLWVATRDGICRIDTARFASGGH